MIKKASHGVGVFIPLPPHISMQYPGGLDGNGSAPHVTFLYFGEVPLYQQDLLVSLLRKSIQKHFPLFVKGRLGALDYFYNPKDNLKVAHLAVRFSHDLEQLRDRVKSDLDDGGYYFKDSYPVFRPHTTLEYMKDLSLDQRYEGVIPSGDFIFNTMEIWGLSEVVHCFCGVRIMEAKKKQYEKEEKSISNFIKRAPKNKPPRKDLRKRRIEDPDLEKGVNKDKDLSLNYKSIGG